MAQANSGEQGNTTYRNRGRSAGRALVGHVFRRVGFWATVTLPLIAIGLLAVQPSGWLPLLVAVFLLNGVALFAGHCYSREC
jgi:hypothetical protein